MTDRPPVLKRSEICCVAEPTDAKRYALLYDRVYVEQKTLNAWKIPPSVAFNFEDVDEAWIQACNSAAGAAAYGGASPEGMTSTLYAYMADLCYQSRKVEATKAFRSYPLFASELKIGTQIGFEAALNHIPMVDVTTTEWQQIIDFREDKESKRKYRDLKLWLFDGLNAENVDQATDIIAKKLDDYEWALQKHGFETKLGALTNLLDWRNSSVTTAASTAALALSGPVASSLAAGVVIAGQAAVWFGNRRLKQYEVARTTNHEIAILKDINDKFA